MSESIIDIQFKAAINDIVEEARLPLNKEIIETWLSNYEELYDAMRNELGNLPVSLSIMHSRPMCAFYNIYRGLAEVKEFYRLEAVCEKAMQEYRQIMATTPNLLNLKSWVAKYETIGTEDLLIPPIFPEYQNYARTIYGVTYFIAGSDFKNITDFYSVFSDLFWKQEILPDSLAEIEWEMEMSRQKK